MLLSGYSCSADSFARYLAGQFSPVFLKGRLPLFTNFTKSKSTKAGPSRSVLLAAPKELCLFVCGRKRAFDVIYWSRPFCGPVLEIFRVVMSCSFPHVKIFRLELFTSNFLKNGPKTSQNNFGWLYRARAVLSMLFSGYSCSADPFARYRAGQFSPVLVHGRKLPTKCRITLKFCPKTTLAGCIAPAKSFQHYLLGTGLLRTRSRDSVLLVNGASARRLFCIAPSVGRCWR